MGGFAIDSSPLFSAATFQHGKAGPSGIFNDNTRFRSRAGVLGQGESCAGRSLLDLTGSWDDRASGEPSNGVSFRIPFAGSDANSSCTLPHSASFLSTDRCDVTPPLVVDASLVMKPGEDGQHHSIQGWTMDVD